MSDHDLVTRHTTSRKCRHRHARTNTAFTWFRVGIFTYSRGWGNRHTDNHLKDWLGKAVGGTPNRVLDGFFIHEYFPCLAPSSMGRGTGAQPPEGLT